MIGRKLGTEKAKIVLEAMSKDSQHFGFIKITEDELANLESLYSPNRMPFHSNVYSFRAGIWVVIILIQANDWVEITILNPYDVNDNHTITNLD